MKFICSLITVKDINKSREFYEKILKQKVKYDFGENVTFKGDFSIHLESHFQKLINNSKILHGGNNFELYFETDNLEDIEKELRQNNIEFIHEIYEQPWRQKVMRFYDPDRNIIEIGESMEVLSYRLYKEGLKIEEIKNYLQISEEFIRDSINKFK